MGADCKKSVWLMADIAAQTLTLYQGKGAIGRYAISTAKNGVGEVINSEKTPRGWHCIRAKIGEAMPPNTVFIERRPTGETFTKDLRAANPTRDWILTRILWLSGLEVGNNRLNNVDTMRRCVYIHGSPDDVVMGKPGSRGCIRMRNADVIALFDRVVVGTRLYISASGKKPSLAACLRYGCIMV